jgi:3-oxoadipate CoA-transferase alpha subunit
MIDKSVKTEEEALEGLFDGCSIMVSGFGGAGLPIALVKALEKTSVRNLTLILNSVRFIEYTAPSLFTDKRVVKVVCSAARSPGKEPGIYERQIKAGDIELELVPQGTFAERLRAGGAGIPAFYTPTGVGTLLAEGKESRVFNGQECLMETALTADFALLRGHVGDRWGNIGFRGLQANFGPAMAMASKTAVVEVTTLQQEALPPNGSHISGIFVNRVIQLPDLR